jgi:hypothetical protein
MAFGGGEADKNCPRRLGRLAIARAEPAILGDMSIRRDAQQTLRSPVLANGGFAPISLKKSAAKAAFLMVARCRAGGLSLTPDLVLASG